MYLFFDTESANCFNSLCKMCEYGFVLTNKSFEIFAKKDILMSPGTGKRSRFYLKGRNGKPGVTLAHEEKEYYESPTFDAFYDDLKDLLVHQNHVVFFFAADSDIQAIEDSCFRYHLEKLPFVCYDVQILYERVMEHKGAISLGHALEALGVDLTGITPHRPDDDAYMTMLVLKGLCEHSKRDVDALLNEFPECRFKARKRYNQLVDRRKARERHRKANMERLAQLQALEEAFPHYKDPVEDWNNTFSVTAALLRDIEVLVPLLQRWAEAGFDYRRRAIGKYLVCSSESQKQSLKKVLFKNGTRIMTCEEFEEVVNRTKK